MTSMEQNLPYPQGEPSHLVVAESGGDEILFYLCQAREALIDTFVAGTMIDEVQINFADLSVSVLYAMVLESINLRKQVLGIDSLQE